LADSNAIDLGFCRTKDRAPVNSDQQTNRFERAICDADCSPYVANGPTMEPTSRDEIERSVVTQEPIPSILGIGQSIIVATQVWLRFASAYQGIRNANSASFAATEQKN